MYTRVVAITMSILSLGATALRAQDTQDGATIPAPEIALPQIGAFVGGASTLIGVFGSYPISHSWGVFTQISRTFGQDSLATWRFDLGVGQQSPFGNSIQVYTGFGGRLAYGMEEQDVWHVGVMVELGLALLLSPAFRAFAESSAGILTGGPDTARPDITLGIGFAYVFPRRM